MLTISNRLFSVSSVSLWFILLLAPCGESTGAASHLPPALPSIPEKNFRVADFGAVGDGKAVETQAIQKAIDTAGAAGGGVVDLPAGEYLCGPLKFVSGLNFRLEQGATVKMLPLDQYPGGLVDPPNFIEGDNLHDIAISGAGTIDGQGAPWWPYAKTKKKEAKRPRMIALRGCDRILIEHVTLKDSPMFHIAIGGTSRNVTVRGVTIRANSSNDPVTPSHNTDACDVSGSHVLIEDCDVSVGDDNFTCGGGTSDVLIRRCTYGNGHGASIGSYTRGEVSNITVEDCTFTNTEAGIRIKSVRGRGGHVHDLVYRNLKMTNVGMPILVYATYGDKEHDFRKLDDLTPEIAAKYPAQPTTNLTPVYENLTFEHIIATASPGKRAGLIWGLPESPISNVVLKDVQITADKPLGIFEAKEVRIENCTIKSTQGINQLMTAHADVKVTP